MDRLNIRTKNRKFETAKDLYGIFFEDINRAGDGGIYPEMIRNRCFEDSLLPEGYTQRADGVHVVTDSGWEDEFNGGEGLSSWVEEDQIEKTSVPGWYAQDARMRLEQADTLNKNRKAALNVRFEKGGSIWNIGFCGIPQKKGEAYKFCLFAKTAQETKLEVSVIENNVCFASTTLLLKGNGYVKYDAVLAATGDSQNAKLIFRCPDGGEILFGFTSLMPGTTYNGHGLRVDLVEKLRDLHPSFMRFPGGCIVEGSTPSTVMLFRNTVGPVWERPGQQLVWHYRSSNGLGFHEYLQLCEDLGMEPLYVCNCGMTCQGRKPVLLTGKEQDEILEDTMNALEYALGSPESRWGSLRTQMGHREPFGLTYLEIGNENFGPDYEERYRRFYDVVKEKYPHLKVIANAHIEEHACTTEYVDEHFYNSTEFFAENQNYYENYDRKGPKIFVGEQAVNEGAHLGKLYGALGEAAFLIGLEKNQDVVALASYAPLFEHVHYHSWSPNLIRFQNAESFGIPTYYVWKMFGKNRGSYVVESEVESGKIYRPMEGMASLKSRSVLNYKNAMWNGRKTAVTHEMMGHVMEEEEDGSCCIGHPDEEQIAAMCRKMPWGDKEKSFVVFGEESDTCGKFDVDIYVEPGSSFEIGIFSARVILSYYDQLLEGAEKIWTPFGVRPLLWKIEEDHASFWETAIPEEKRLTEDFPLCIEPGRYHHFGYETDGKTVRLFIDRKIVREVEIPSFPAVSSVTTVTEDEIFIKLVNMEGKTDPIEISLDCGVEREYEAVLLTGEKTAENTFEEPEKVSDKTVKMEGASKKFIYEAPTYSVSVLRLKKKQAFNPYLPSWEYIPDGEPYVFGDRVYVYGSHDFYNGHVFCLGDYVCWSAPVDNLADWRYEGVIYPKTEDPLNRDGKMCLYAPDVTVGPDGRYYLYYVLDHVSVVSVAVSDTPAGKYEFYGYVHDKKGDRLGERPGDEPQFDPGVLTEGARTYLYTGFCGRGDKTRHGAMATVLGPDMITIEEEPVFVAPGGEYADGTGYEGHAFFEAPSIRKIGNTYYLIYSSSVMHELCYATSEKPTGKFTYRGVLVSNCDMHIDTYKPADMPSAYGGNNHGSIVEISSEWYIFYHRQTNGTWYSRQGCAEKLHLAEDGSFRQVELTSCGLNGGSLVGRGEYPAYIACNLFTAEESIFDANQRFPRVMQDGRDGDKEPGYISHITDTTTLGFKYFECENVQKVILKVRGYGSGTFEVKTAWDGEVLGTVQIVNSNVWEKYEIQAQIPDGKQAIYFTYRGYGNLDLLSFTLE